MGILFKWNLVLIRLKSDSYSTNNFSTLEEEKGVWTIQRISSSATVFFRRVSILDTTRVPRACWKYRATTSNEEGRWPTRDVPKNEDAQSLPWPVVLGSTRSRLSLSTLQQLRKHRFRILGRDPRFLDQFSTVQKFKFHQVRSNNSFSFFKFPGFEKSVGER